MQFTWDSTRLGSRINLSQSNRTATCKDGGKYDCVMGSQLIQMNVPSLSFAIRFDKMGSDRLYVGLAYDNASLQDSCNSQNLVLSGCGSLVEFGNWRKAALSGGIKQGDIFEVKVSPHKCLSNLRYLNFFSDRPRAASSVSGRYDRWTGDLLP
jgi:hypothetical protein